jgi:predicted ester cyclase
MIAEGDEVVTRVTIDASSAAGQRQTWSGIGIIRLQDGRIVEQWADTDSIGAALNAMQPQPQ